MLGDNVEHNERDDRPAQYFPQPEAAGHATRSLLSGLHSAAAALATFFSSI